MPIQNFTIKYKKNSGRALSASEVKSLYFFGIPLVDPTTGKEIPDEDFEFYIDAAQQELQNYLQILFTRQLYTETHDFWYDDWTKWGYIKTKYPVVDPVSIKGFLNTVLQVDYPSEWLSAKRVSDNIHYWRKLNLVPVQGASSGLSGNSIYTGISPHIGYFGNKNIPNYWEVSYVTGWDSVPKDILNVMGKMVAINIFHQLGDLIVGAGIAGKSIGIDGLSQSVQTTSSAENSGYSGRILGYLKDLDRSLPILKNSYKGITFAVA